MDASQNNGYGPQFSSGPFPQAQGQFQGQSAGQFQQPPFPQQYPAEQNTKKQRNVLGVIALVTSVLGLILACIPGILIVGWILLPIGFILGLVALFLSGKSKWEGISAIVVSIIGSIVATIVLVAVVGNALNETFGDGDVTVSQGDSASSGDGSSDSAEGDAGAGELGSRENPVAIGDTFGNDDWEVTVDSVNLDANSVIEAENPFSDPVPEGKKYAIFSVTAHYLGEGSADTLSLRFDFVGADGSVTNQYDSMAIVPEPRFGSELYTGGTHSGDLAIAIPENADGLLRVGLGLGDEVFVKVS